MILLALFDFFTWQNPITVDGVKFNTYKAVICALAQPDSGEETTRNNIKNILNP